ncbi:GerMN domain-containing protein [Nocardioides jiangxiensis]|uniref:LpqB family beta-propeller domain-containing protein n=1 Tax=Nocardioides jiangxiensis TaxID=3064524 RepID=A0ABT9AY24_9ACTN|nr:GerMN domain-containing protein [Nocardioides sp. WY-20]MDO7867471.1 LpqB family beta-propeller domain-containing protein [Nocardioides sp. WY-20]
MTRSGRTAVAGLLLALLTTGGCASLPDSGGVEAQEGDALPSDAGIRYVPPGPLPGATPEAVVSGFLDAMLASPVQTSTAREFLTADAAAGWRPQQRVVVYGGVAGTPGGAPGDLTLADTAWVDAGGRWRGELPAAERRVRLGLVREKGQWRISALPDALLVRRTWFVREYGQFDVHFLDPGRSVLVPEPVFEPRGGQLATALVRSLLAGPPDPAAPWLLNRLAELRLSEGAVTVTDGVAELDFTGPAPTSPGGRTELAAQLAWTLRQVPGVRTFEVRVDDTPLTLEGGLTEIPVGSAGRFDPAGADASDGLFGLVGGRPARVDGATATPVSGRSWRSLRLRELSVDLRGTAAAGVSDDGREVRIGSLDAAGQVTTVHGSDLAHPAWDAAGRTWLLDRRTSGAVVTVAVGSRLAVVAVPGVSGRDVADLLVSRDGTRLVAAVRTGRRSTVVVSRLQWRSGGVTASPAVTIAEASGLRDLAWSGPTTVVALTEGRGVGQVRWLSLDGSPDDVREALPVDTIFDDVRRVVSSGAEGEPAWVVTASGDLVGTGPVREPAPVARATALTWAG